MKDFVEREDGAFRDQLRSFGIGLGTHGATLGFTSGEIAAAKTKLNTTKLDAGFCLMRAGERNFKVVKSTDN